MRESLASLDYSILPPLLYGPKGPCLPEEISKDPEWQLYLFPDKPTTLARFRQLRHGKVKNLRF